MYCSSEARRVSFDYEHTDGITHDTNEAIAFLADFFGDAQRPLIAIRKREGRPDIRAHTFAATDIEKTRKWIADFNQQGFDIYFGVNPLKSALDKKANKGDVAEARWLWIDLDPAKGADLDAERVEMLALLTDIRSPHALH